MEPERDFSSAVLYGPPEPVRDLLRVCLNDPPMLRQRDGVHDKLRKLHGAVKGAGLGSRLGHPGGMLVLYHVLCHGYVAAVEVGHC